MSDEVPYLGDDPSIVPNLGDDVPYLGDERIPATRNSLEPLLQRNEGWTGRILGLTHLTKSGKKASYEDLKNAYRGKGFLDRFLTGHVPPNPSGMGSTAMFESVGAPASMVRLPFAKAAEGISGKPLPGADIHSAVRGEAPSWVSIADQTNPKTPLINKILGIPLDILTDPLAKFLGPPSDYQGPASYATSGLGKKVHALPFREADYRVTEFRDGVTRGPREVSDIFWNQGKPLLQGKTNKEIVDTIKNTEQEAYGWMKDAMEKAKNPITLSPGFNKAHEEFVTNAPIEHAMNIYNQHVSAANLEAMFAARAAKAANAGPDFINNLKEQIQANGRRNGRRAAENFFNDKDAKSSVMLDAHNEFPKIYKDKLMTELAGGTLDKKAFFARLRDHMPDFSPEINRAEKLYTEGEQALGNDIVDKLIDIGTEGDRTTLETHSLARKFSDKAAGNEAFKRNAFKRTGGQKVTDKDASNMSQRGILMDLVRKNTAREGQANIDQFEKGAKIFGALRRGEEGMEKSAKYAEKTPLGTMAKLWLLIRAGARPTAENIAEATIPAAWQTMSKRPRVGIEIGSRLNDLGQSNILDRLLLRNATINEEK